MRLAILCPFTRVRTRGSGGGLLVGRGVGVGGVARVVVVGSRESVSVDDWAGWGRVGDERHCGLTVIRSSCRIW